MFFKYNNTSWSQLDTLLAKENLTLQEVMDNEDVINECRVQNKNLIDFLLKPEVIEELVILTVKEPSVELGETTRFKYPNLASELLTCDVPAINERLAGDEKLLEKLYEFLENESPLNPLLASFFSKIMGGLIAKKTEQNWVSYQLTCLQVLDFLKARESFLPLLMKHLGTSAIMDLMLKLMTQVEGVEMRQNILNWLDSQRIVQQLVSLLNPKIEKERHDNVAQLLCDFLRIARDAQRGYGERADPDPLLNTLESPETVKLLLDQIFDNEKSESSIVGGISVLLCLLDVHQANFPGFRSVAYLMKNIYNSNLNDEDVDYEQKQRVLHSTSDAIVPKIKDFHDLLLNPPKQAPVLTTVGLLEPPVGNTRLQVVRLLSVLLGCESRRVQEELTQLGTFSVLLDLFFRYPWNNFLHTYVESCLVASLETAEGGEPNALTKHILGDCELIERVLKAWKDNDEQQELEKRARQGYMGHLVSIANHLIKLRQNSLVGDYLGEIKPEMLAALDDFKATTLTKVLEQQDKLLGGLHPNSLIEDDLGVCPLMANSALQQQTYAQFQMQDLPSQYLDTYSGLNDDVFNDGDDTLQTIDNPSDVNFDLSESDMLQRDAIFKQVCAQSINTLFDSDDQVFEERDHTFQTVIEKKDQKKGGRNNSSSSSGSDEDDEDTSPDGAEESNKMNVDPWTSPKGSPWGVASDTVTTSSANDDGWADFSSANFSELEERAASGDGKHESANTGPAVEQPSISVEGDACPVAAQTSDKESPLEKEGDKV
ncbi:hypothetical protein ABEB36_001941 [Hypothenemus hampei]|uniref:Serine/threonine-protein phosphatase 6 regulatory subunit 3 n=1 Tax=Hypothenemus hampei TaxID=57062 RepID=A0ABD1FG73_HYPHA